MTNDEDWFKKEPKPKQDVKFAPQDGTEMDLLYCYKPKTTEQLAEWLMMASNSVVDQDGRRIINPLKPYAAYQIARMMQIAKLKVPQ